MFIAVQIKYDKKIYEREDAAKIYEYVDTFAQTLLNEQYLRRVKANDAITPSRLKELVSDQEYLNNQKRDYLRKKGVYVDYDFDEEVTRLMIKVGF